MWQSFINGFKINCQKHHMKYSDYDNSLYGIGKRLFDIALPMPLRKLLIYEEGKENVPEDGPCIIAPRHNSLADPPVLGISIDRELYFLAKKDILDWPVAGRLLRRLNTIGIEGMDYYDRILKTLEDGYPLVIFPEGGTPKRGTDRKTGRGAIRTALSMKLHGADAPVIPVGMEGPVLWCAGKPVLYCGRVKVRFGPKIEFGQEDLDSYKEMNERGYREGMKEIEWRYTHHLVDEISRLSGDAGTGA